MSRKFIAFLGICASCFLQSCRNESARLSDHVNPFIGASTNTEAAGAYHGLGKTFPYYNNQHQ